MASWWTDERVDEFRQMIKGGYSSGEIASAMGNTREAVCGKAHRMGLQLREGNLGPTRGRAKPKPERARVQQMQPERRPFLAITDDTLAKMAAVPDVARVASILELEDHHCKYPIGASPAGFCGSARVTGLPYCKTHSVRCYRPQEATSRAVSTSVFYPAAALLNAPAPKDAETGIPITPMQLVKEDA